MGLGDRFGHTPIYIHALTRTPSDYVENFLSMPSGVWASSQKQPVAASVAGSCDTMLLPWELCADSLMFYIGHQISAKCGDLCSLLSQPGLLEWMSDLELVDFELSCQFLELSPR